MIPIAILASGRGSNFDAILAATRAGTLAAKIVAALSDKPQAPVLEKARAAGIPALAVPVPADPAIKARPLDERRRIHDERVLEALSRYAPRFLVMAGYMRVVSPDLLRAFRSERGYSRVVNIHPSLLPSFPGVAGYAQAFDYGACMAGVTVHLVSDEMDAGPVCAQEAFSIADCRTAVEVEERGLKIEHRLYPETLSWVLPENFKVEERRGRICVRKS